MYPGSKFILTVRDGESWIASVRQHWARMLITDDAEGRYRRWVRLSMYGTFGFSEGRMRSVYETHVRNVTAYFAGRLKAFDLPLAPKGSAHELEVWAQLCRIPYGETITYGELARRTGTVARAVGGTCGANPIAIVIPCHRVTAAGGFLGGYSGGDGRDSKRRLLAHEAKYGGAFALSP